MDGRVVLNGETYPLAHGALLPKGKRAWTRTKRDSQPTDRGVPKQAVWKLSGPLGNSRANLGDVLGIDYANLEHRFDGLLTSLAARNTLDLSGDDPDSGGILPTTLPMTLGAFSKGNIDHIVQDRRFLAVARGQAFHVVDPSSMTAVKTIAKDAPIQGMAVWKDKARVGYGSSREIETITTINGSGAQFEAVSGQYAKRMTIGNDRWWGISGDPTGDEENHLFYSLDDFLSFSNSFAVGDDKIPATGLGTLGAFTAAGSETGAFSFTDAGKVVRLIEDLKDFRSTKNGISIASQWGWMYVCTELGLYAVQPGQIANPVGPGEGTDGQGFEGEIDGVPIYVFAWKGLLWVIYLTPGGDSWALIGQFGELTPGTGRPDWFTFRKFSSTEVHCISATSARTNPTLLFGEGEDTLSWYTMGRRARDIADPNYVFSTDGGQWFGTRVMLPAGMRGFPRYFAFRTENCDASNTWQVALSVDEGSYTNVGSAVESDGLQRVRPVSGGAPVSALSGTSFKPRLTQVAASSSSPPQIRGDLTMLFDMVADVVEDHSFLIHLGSQRHADTELSDLNDLFDDANSAARSPISVHLPEEKETKYGFVTHVGEVQDAGPNGEQTVMVRMTLWEVS